jgi:hypothetical protein
VQPTSSWSRASRPSPYLYLYGCDPYFDRVDLAALRATGTWNLHERAPQHVLPVERTDGCAIHSPVVEHRTGRMFVAAPKTPSEDAEGHRFDSIVGVQLGSFDVTDVFGGDWSLEDPVALLVDDQSHLLASTSQFDLPFGVGSGSVTWTDVSTVGKPRKMVTRQGVSFTPAAVFEGGTIWDAERAIRMENGRPTQHKLDLSELLPEPRGAALVAYSTHDSPITHRPFVLNNFLGGHGNRTLFNLPDQTTMTLVIGTITPPSARVLKTQVPAGASAYLIADGKSVVMVEQNGSENTGRLITLDADSGAVRRDWHVGELQLPPIHYLCAGGDVLFFGTGKSLIVVHEGSSKVTSIAVERQIDSYARCLFADR